MGWLLLFAVVPAIADPVDPRAVDLTVKQEVDRLSSSRAAERRLAEQALLERGPVVLPLLPEPGGVEDVAAQDALERIRRELENRAALGAALPGRVTFQGIATLEELLGELQRQTGNAMRLAPDVAEHGELRGDVFWDQTPFWRAVEDLARTFGLEVATTVMTREVVLQAPAKSWDVPEADTVTQSAGTATESSFRVTVTQLSRRTADAGTGSLWQVRLAAQAEPRLRPLFVAVRDADLRFIGSAGEWSPFNPQSAREIDFTQSGTASWDVICMAPPGETGEGLSLSGRFEVELLGGVRELRFAGLAGKPPIVRRSGQVVAVLETIAWSSDGDQLQIGLLLRYAAGGPAFESHRVAAIFREAGLELPDGRRVPAEPEAEFTLEQNGALGVRYRFVNLPESARQGTLVYTVPTALVRAPVEVRLASPQPSAVPSP